MKDTRNRLWISLMALSLVAVVGTFMIIKLERIQRPPCLPDDSDYAILKSECYPRVQANHFLVSSNAIYVQFEGNPYSLINVYSINGDFQYGIQYTDHYNGTSCIGLDGDDLLFKSHDNYAYVIRKGKILEQYKPLQGSQKIGEFEAKCNESHSHIKGDSVYVLTSDGIYLLGESNILVISLPPVIPVSYGFLLAFILFCFGLDGFLDYIDAWRKRNH